MRVVADPDDAEHPSNLVFFASARPLDWRPATWTGLSKATQERLAHQQKTFVTSEAVVITDELNPLDLWQVDKSESYRKWILEQFPVEVLID